MQRNITLYLNGVKLDVEPGDMVRMTTQYGEVELASRQDDAIPDGVASITSPSRKRRPTPCTVQAVTE